MNRRTAWMGVAFATLIILIATLHPSGSTPPPNHWDLHLTIGEAAFSELIQNLLLFVPLGACLALAGVRPLPTVLLGAALSFSVEFAQQFIPGRDPSLGDITANTVSTGLGMALAVTAPRWLWATLTPTRAARRALGVATAAVLVWAGTGILLRPIFPAPPYRDVWTPDFNFWGHYRGKVLTARLGGDTLKQDTIGDAQFLLKIGAPLQVTAVASNRPPGRASPLVAFLDKDSIKVLALSVDGSSLVARYHTQAIAYTFEQLDLRWRRALARVAPKDTFVAQLWRGERGICMSLNSERKCGFGYTIGDGWKLIFYPEDFPPWLLGLLNICWVAGWTIGVGWFGKAAVGKAAVITAAAGILLLLGLIAVPIVTGLNGTPFSEWIGALGGLAVGYSLNGLRRY